MWMNNDGLASLYHPKLKTHHHQQSNQTMNARWLICLLCILLHLSCVFHETEELICRSNHNIKQNMKYDHGKNRLHPS